MTEVEVMWRPGCPYCRALRSELHGRGVEATWRNIWSDAEARDLVRVANGGDETVPTVRVGDTWLTNPGWSDIAPLLGRNPDEPAREPDAPAYSSPGGPGSVAGQSPWIALVRSMSLVVFLGAGFWLLARDSVVAGVLALLVGATVWTLTRPTPTDPRDGDTP